MSSPCRGCKMSGRTSSKEQSAKLQMESTPRKALESMSDEEVLEECATWMALKNGSDKDQTKATLGSLPAAHVKIMLEKLRSGQ
jgi:hypothetical protein